MIKTICDSANHTRFTKEDHLPDWARRDNKVTKGDRVVIIISARSTGLPYNRYRILHASQSAVRYWPQETLPVAHRSTSVDTTRIGCRHVLSKYERILPHTHQHSADC